MLTSAPLRPWFLCSLLSVGLLVSPGCKGDDGEGDDGTAGTIYDRLGGEDGIRSVVEDAVLNRIAADARINAYFLNDGVDIGITINCLVIQLGSLTGGPQVYPGPDCRDMKSSHEDLGISQQDFLDLAEHFVGAMTDAGVAQEDIDVIVAALVDMAPDIVEDPDSNATVYQRIGRKPAIQAAVADFYTAVSTDPAIMAFFADTDQTRFEACLARQLCSIDGPCLYGKEAIGLDPSYGGSVCRDMLTSHEGLMITIEDFGALAADLEVVLTDAGVATADKDAIMGVLGPMCAEIVADPTMCP